MGDASQSQRIRGRVRRALSLLGNSELRVKMALPPLLDTSSAAGLVQNLNRAGKLTSEETKSTNAANGGSLGATVGDATPGSTPHHEARLQPLAPRFLSHQSNLPPMAEACSGHRLASSGARGPANGGGISVGGTNGGDSNGALTTAPAHAPRIARRQSYMSPSSEGCTHEIGGGSTGHARGGVPGPLPAGHPQWLPPPPTSPPLVDVTMLTPGAQPLPLWPPRAAAAPGGEVPPQLKRTTLASPEAVLPLQSGSRHGVGKPDGFKRHARTRVGPHSPSPEETVLDAANGKHAGAHSGAGGGLGGAAVSTLDPPTSDRPGRGAPAVIVRVSRSYEHPFGGGGAPTGPSQRYVQQRLSPPLDAPVLAYAPSVLPSILPSGGTSQPHVAGSASTATAGMLASGTASPPPPGPGCGAPTKSPQMVGGGCPEGGPGAADAASDGEQPPKSPPLAPPRRVSQSSGAPILDEGKSAKERLLLARRVRQGSGAPGDVETAMSPPFPGDDARAVFTYHPATQWEPPPSLHHRRSTSPLEDDLTRMSWDGGAPGGSQSPGVATSMSVSMGVSSGAALDTDRDADDSFNSSATSDLMAMLERRAPGQAPSPAAGCRDGAGSRHHASSGGTSVHTKGCAHGGGAHRGEAAREQPLGDSWAADRLWAPLCELSGPGAGLVPALDFSGVAPHGVEQDSFSSPGMPLPSATPHGISPPLIELPPVPVGIELSAALNGTIDLHGQLMHAPVACKGDGPLRGGLHYRQVRDKDPVRRAVDLKRELKKKREGDEQCGGKGRGMSAVDAAIASLYVNFNGFGEWPARTLDVVNSSPQECTAPST